IVWVPWKRPGFELALLIEKAVTDHPGADGLILGSHGLFTWGHTQRECYLTSIRTIDQMGEFIAAHQARRPAAFGGLIHAPCGDRRIIAAQILPALRDANPSVVIVPGLGLFGFGKSKKEARITTEFFANAVHVMAGATALEDGSGTKPLPQARRADRSDEFEKFHNYVALPRREAFRIEYWTLEEAKLQRQPPEAEFSRKIVAIVGGGSGIGREVALQLARKGAHLVVADVDGDSAANVAAEAAKLSSADMAIAATVDLGSSASLAQATTLAALQFGGLDAIVNTAAIYPVAGAEGWLTESQWALTFKINVTGNYLLAQQTEWIFKDQQL